MCGGGVGGRVVGVSLKSSRVFLLRSVCGCTPVPDKLGVRQQSIAFTGKMANNFFKETNILKLQISIFSYSCSSKFMIIIVIRIYFIRVYMGLGADRINRSQDLDGEEYLCVMLSNRCQVYEVADRLRAIIVCVSLLALTARALSAK